MKKGIKLLLLAGIILFCCSCGKTDKKEAGRYVEEVVELPGARITFTGLAQEGETLRLTDLYGEDMVSVDGGRHFTEAKVLPAAYRDERTSTVASVAGRADGSRIIAEYMDGTRVWKLVTADGVEISLKNMGDGYPCVYSGRDFFYMCKENEIYQIDPVNGEVNFLTECTSFPFYLVEHGGMLFIVHQSGVLLYDLQNKEVAEKQDDILSAFLDGRITNYGYDGYSCLLCPSEENIYILTHNGLYRHELYGEGMECILDGSLYCISNIDREFIGMAVAEKDTFYVYYSDGNLMRYTFDETLAAEPDISLRIYSLYEDGNIRMAVSAFREKYPDWNIQYEVGINPDYAITAEDAMRNLSTEIAAGKGPDILVMDDIPYENYIEKGILEDLSFIREEMQEEEFFLPVIDGFANAAQIYVLPLTFAVPVLAGDEEWIAKAEKVENLSQLTAILEEASQEQEGSVIGFRSAEEALSLFAQSSMGAWVTEEGILNRDAVEEFLEQVKGIYEIQMNDMPENVENWIFSGLEWGKGENTLARIHGSYGLSEAESIRFMLFPSQPFYAGYLTGSQEDYPMTIGKMNYAEGTYILMPGQNYGTCLPATLMAMNSASLHKEQGSLFLEYIFSEEFQGKVSLNGTPVNRRAYLSYQVNPKEDDYRSYGTYACTTWKGEAVYIDIYWPAKKDFVQLDNMLNSVSGVNICDARIYEMVIEMGQEAVIGEAGVEETVDAIEKELELYLAE